VKEIAARAVLEIQRWTRAAASFGSTPAGAASLDLPNRIRDATEISASALPSWPISTSPAPPLATDKMTGSPFQVLMGLALCELVHIRVSVFSCRQVACRHLADGVPKWHDTELAFHHFQAAA
jgi:hypothetical protein